MKTPRMIDAMILAAGLGTRMEPLTRVCPKALLPVCGRPLLAWALRDLAAWGAESAAAPEDTPTEAEGAENTVRVRDVVINAHHHAEQLRVWCEKYAADDESGSPRVPRVRVLHEPDLLGTAGGLANAAPYLRSDPVVVRNVDLFLPLEIAPLLTLHAEAKPRATLVLVRDPEHALIRVEQDRVVEIRRRPEPENRDLWCFSGIYLLSQSALAELPRPGFAELTPLLRRWAEQGLLAAHLVDGPFREVGTLETYFAVQRELVRNDSLRTRLLGSASLGDPWVEPGARIGAGANLEETIVLAGTTVDGSAAASRSILGPPEILGGSLHEVACAGGVRRALALLGPAEEEALTKFANDHRRVWTDRDDERPRADSDVPGPPDPPRLRLVHGGGSHRHVLRVTSAGCSAILVSNPPLPESAAAVYPRRSGGAGDENETFLYVAEILRGRGVRVPSVLAYDAARGFLLLEDAGATSLFDAAAKAGSQEIAAHYEAAVDILLRMQRPVANVELDPDRTHNPDYDPAFVRRYEIDYFTRELVQGLAGCPAPDGELEREYTALALAAGSPRRRCFLHRDFQSRNLLLTRGELVVIDFQGARLGPQTYDLASLLFDPYVSGLDEIREPLVERYLAGCAPANRRAAAQELTPVAIVRLLQTLGAFAYLGYRLGKPDFLPHAPLALARLGRLARASYPHLAALADQLAEVTPIAGSHRSS